MQLNSIYLNTVQSNQVNSVQFIGIELNLVKANFLI